MGFHHHLGTIHPKQLRILHAGIQRKCVWSWGVKSAASQFSPYKVGSPEPCSALLFAKPLTDHCKAEIFVHCRQAGTIQQLVLAWLSVARLWHEYTKQVVNINHPTACIGMLVMNPPTAHVHKLVILCQPDQTHQQLVCICFSIFAAYIWNCYSWTMQKPFDIAHSCTLLW